MDSSYYFALGTSSPILPKLSFKNVENRFLGEKINNNNGTTTFKRFASDLDSKKFGNRKFKHCVVYAVATSNNPKEAMVCVISLLFFSLAYNGIRLCFVLLRFISTLHKEDCLNVYCKSPQEFLILFCCFCFLRK